ncbi:unnamed protein product, partial [Owenia fusiformis]
SSESGPESPPNAMSPADNRDPQVYYDLSGMLEKPRCANVNLFNETTSLFSSTETARRCSNASYDTPSTGYTPVSSVEGNQSSLLSPPLFESSSENQNQPEGDLSTAIKSISDLDPSFKQDDVCEKSSMETVPSTPGSSRQHIAMSPTFGLYNDELQMATDAIAAEEMDEILGSPSYGVQVSNDAIAAENEMLTSPDCAIDNILTSPGFPNPD